jgi:hypothetical protein
MKTIQIFSFEELSPEAQEVALEQFKLDIDRGVIPPSYDHDPIIEGIVEDLNEMGIEKVDVQYSGFWSQGDGLSFTGEVEDVPFFIEKLGLKIDKYSRINFVRGSSRYSHENTVHTELSIDYDDEPTFKETWNKAYDLIEDWRKSKCNEFYNRLEKYYNECNSEESLKDELIEREYHFTEKGKKVNL